MNKDIQHIKQHRIDTLKWDACIEKANNGLIYGYTFYLNKMARHWDGLVLNDYEAVMPLTWNRKYGIYYLYQPPFTASLGIFGNQLNAALINDFIYAIPSRYRYWDIYLNHGNYYQVHGYQFYDRMNYVLSLQGNYDSIYKRFSDNIKRNIKKAGQAGCVVRKDINLHDVISLSQANTNASKKDFLHLAQLYDYLYQNRKAVTYGVYSAADQLVASAAFLFDNKRAYYILAGNHHNGKSIGASHALINTFIKDHVQDDIQLDFEGSDISTLANYYSSFGATLEKYPGLMANHLPLPLKWMKKN